MAQQVATLGGGCFWCLEAVYLGLRGVSAVMSGYAGGHVENPSYEAVCAKGTGHAEVVNVTFNPQEISFKEILQVFFTVALSFPSFAFKEKNERIFHGFLMLFLFRFYIFPKAP